MADGDERDLRLYADGSSGAPQFCGLKSYQTASHGCIDLRDPVRGCLDVSRDQVEG